MTAPELVLREMTSTDIDTLVALDADLFAKDAWPASTWWAELAERPRREYLVLESGGEIAAYGGIDHGGESADIMTLAVAASAQGRGVGARMLGALESAAARRGAHGALLEVRSDNPAARALYEGAGWRVLHVRQRYYQPGGVDAIVMGKTLGERRIDD